MRTCHYEVLGVERDATDSEIRKAYMKLALKWHPDKNTDNPEEATVKFRGIQEAYEVLSDPHERAWYDNHRESILRGDERGEGTEDDFLPDLMQYFSAACFKGHNDAEKGFYTVYRGVFEEIALTENKFSEDGKPSPHPSFGTSTTGFDKIKEFYNFWGNFSSKMTFGWKEKYNLSDAPSRQVRRLMEKENKKEKDAARKEYNETIRKLVEFVKKRDKRFEAEIAKKQEETKRKEEEAKQKILEEKKKRVKEASEYQVPEWARVNDSALESLTKEYAVNYDEENDEFVCVACKKSFRSEKQWDNHAKSKKHIENMALLEAQRAEEEEEEEEEEGGKGNFSDEDVDPENWEIQDGSENEGEEEEVNEEDFPVIDESEPEEAEEQEKPSSPSTITPSMEALSVDKGQEQPPEVAKDESDDDEDWGKKKKDKKGKKKGKVGSSNSSSSAGIKRSIDPQVKAAINQSQQKKKGGKQAESDNEGSEDLEGTRNPASADGEEFTCNVCGESFPTRNRLFAHITKTKHARAVPSDHKGDDNDDDDDYGKKRKGKKKNVK